MTASGSVLITSASVEELTEESTRETTKLAASRISESVAVFEMEAESSSCSRTEKVAGLRFWKMLKSASVDIA